MFGNDDQSNKKYEDAFNKVVEIFGDIEKAIDWMNAECPELEQQIPILLLHSPDGYEQVMSELERIKSGAAT